MRACSGQGQLLFALTLNPLYVLSVRLKARKFLRCFTDYQIFNYPTLKISSSVEYCFQISVKIVIGKSDNEVSNIMFLSCRSYSDIS